MKISIIIPCYNCAEHLIKCINSVLRQTHTDFELLLLDDGSNDYTLAVCEKYKLTDARIKVFHHENRGVSYTRNRGIELASADYIMFIDGDDWIEEEMIESIFCVDDKLPTMYVCGMIHERKRTIFKNDFFLNLIQNQTLVFDKNEFMRLFPSSAIFSPCCKVYNKVILIKEAILFDESLSYQEDLVFNLKYISHLQRIMIVPRFTYHYVEHAVSSSSGYHKNLLKSVGIVNELLLSLPNYNSNKRAIERFNLHQVLKLISNVMHQNSGLSITAKYIEIQKVMNSTILDESKTEIATMKIGKLLKLGLLCKNTFLIMAYFSLHKLVN